MVMLEGNEDVSTWVFILSFERITREMCFENLNFLDFEVR